MNKMKRRQEMPQRNDFDPIIDKFLDPFIDRLTSVDANRRRDAVDRILADAIPVVRVRIIDRLIELLKGRSEAASSRAADSLVQLGEIALPALHHKLLNSPNSRMVQRIASILGAIGAKAPPYSQVSIQMNLDIVSPEPGY